MPGTDGRTDDAQFYEDVAALLAPGDATLHGVVVHTDLTGDDESRLHQTTIEVGDVVAEHVVGDPTDTYVYSGNDDSEFGLNQHQGRTLDGDETVWECQQPLRDGTFDVVVYWEAAGVFDDVVAALGEAGHDVVPVTEDGPVDGSA
ncbi:MAG: DUF5778 family protein [Halobacteriaceae archaeon]